MRGPEMPAIFNTINLACRQKAQVYSNVRQLAIIQPRVLVLLGATAAQSLLGREFRVTQNRRKLIDSELAEAVTATIHPSAILRGEPERREAEFAAFVDDLRFVARLV